MHSNQSVPGLSGLRYDSIDSTEYFSPFRSKTGCDSSLPLFSLKLVPNETNLMRLATIMAIHCRDIEANNY